MRPSYNLKSYFLQQLFRPENIAAQVGRNFVEVISTTIGWTIVGALFGQGLSLDTSVTKDEVSSLHVVTLQAPALSQALNVLNVQHSFVNKSHLLDILIDSAQPARICSQASYFIFLVKSYFEHNSVDIFYLAATLQAREHSNAGRAELCRVHLDHDRLGYHGLHYGPGRSSAYLFTHHCSKEICLPPQLNYKYVSWYSECDISEEHMPGCLEQQLSQERVQQPIPRDQSHLLRGSRDLRGAILRERR